MRRRLNQGAGIRDRICEPELLLAQEALSWRFGSGSEAGDDDVWRKTPARRERSQTAFLTVDEPVPHAFVVKSVL